MPKKRPSTVAFLYLFVNKGTGDSGWCNILEAVKQSGKTTISTTELVSAPAGRTKKKQKIE